MKYRGYTIKKSGFNYVVITPKGEQWAEVAANRATAKRWIDARITELLIKRYESK